jgi:hypothetical protein
MIAGEFVPFAQRMMNIHEEFRSDTQIRSRTKNGHPAAVTGKGSHASPLFAARSKRAAALELCQYQRESGDREKIVDLGRRLE